ncbi:MAG: hypothetical protein KKA73_31280 [Chloroflexi bacterium]|nr:hypothetical protein [Chloroflexota bacterium]MBU1752185.1 hypothetical protein [Chloroflexota bacterium]
MTIRLADVKPGLCVVGMSYLQDVVRRVIQEHDDGTVTWESYDLRTGHPVSTGRRCSRRRIVQWAYRRATDEEIARLAIQDMAQRRQIQRDQLLDTIAEEWGVRLP